LIGDVCSFYGKIDEFGDQIRKIEEIEEESSLSGDNFERDSGISRLSEIDLVILINFNYTRSRWCWWNAENFWIKIAQRGEGKLGDGSSAAFESCERRIENLTVRIWRIEEQVDPNWWNEKPGKKTIGQWPDVNELAYSWRKYIEDQV